MEYFGSYDSGAFDPGSDPNPEHSLKISAYYYPENPFKLNPPVYHPEHLAHQVTSDFYHRLISQGMAEGYVGRTTGILFELNKIGAQVLLEEGSLYNPDTSELCPMDSTLATWILSLFSEGCLMFVHRCQQLALSDVRRKGMIEHAAQEIFHLSKEMTLERWLSDCPDADALLTQLRFCQTPSEEEVAWMHEVGENLLMSLVDSAETCDDWYGETTEECEDESGEPEYDGLEFRQELPLAISDTPLDTGYIFDEIKAILPELLSAGPDPDPSQGFHLSEGQYQEAVSLLNEFVAKFSAVPLPEIDLNTLQAQPYHHTFQAVLMFAKGFFHAFGKCLAWSLTRDQRRGLLQEVTPDILKFAMQVMENPAPRPDKEAFLHAVEDLSRQALNRRLNELIQI